MNWSVAVNALCFPEPPVVSWPDDRRRVVQLLGSQPECKRKSARDPEAGARPSAPALSDEALIAALRTGRVTGPASVAGHFGVSRSSGHRHLTRLAVAGRLERMSWGHWRIVD